MLKRLILIALLAALAPAAGGQAPNVEWQHSLGSTAPDQAWAIEQTADSGYLIAASASFNDGDVKGHYGGSDFWIVKLSRTGTVQWQKCYGGSGSETPRGMYATRDNCYIIAGTTTSTDGDVLNPGG